MLSETGLLRLWQQVYAMTDAVTPLAEDCGNLCDAICCHDWDENVGMYLWPGEQLILAGVPWLERQWHDAKTYVFPHSWGRGGWFVTCQGTCNRHLRPFSCRTFPLTPHLDARDRLQLILDPSGRSICPLIQSDTPELLTAHFRLTMRRAWELLLGVAPIRDEVKDASRSRIVD